MTVNDMVARQMRIERQEASHCQQVSFDRDAANVFQHYVHDTLAFSIKRGGFLYGEVREDGHVLVDFIYEPPQHGTEHTLQIFTNEAEERAVAAIAAGLGMRCVGFIVTQTLAEDEKAQEHSFTLSASDVLLAARFHCATAIDSSGGKAGEGGEGGEGNGERRGEGERDGGGGGKEGEKEGEKGGEPFKDFAVVLVKLLVDEEGEGGGDVHFEAFQLSDQCLKLYREGWFAGDGRDEGEGAEGGKQDPGAGGGRDKGKGKVGEKEGKGKNAEEKEEEDDPKVSRMRKQVVVAGRDTYEVDNDFFLMPVKIVDHQGPLSTSFPVENRIILPTQNDLKQHLERSRSKAWADRLADFHLLLYLSNFLDASTDMPMLAQAVRTKEPISEGHQLIIEHLA
ncbi:hypothetical protein CLOM_g14993 [Closterium sp. NIES-68]|nr:hypothetical protein CLOM_g14993 [Closterium sp. NIES-68]GJP60383.1 hypothetical protein CLOP_g17594 [Closterium sp. NIES-67]